MKKKIFLTLFCLLMQISASSAANQLKVAAMSEFKTDKPAKTIDVRVLESSPLGKYNLEVASILHCQVIKIVDPKRGKRSAIFFVKPIERFSPKTNQFIKVHNCPHTLVFLLRILSRLISVACCSPRRGVQSTEQLLCRDRLSPAQPYFGISIVFLQGFLTY